MQFVTFEGKLHASLSKPHFKIVIVCRSLSFLKAKPTIFIQSVKTKNDESISIKKK